MKSLMPQIDSNDGLFHNGNPATGEQGTRVTDTWLNNLQDRVRDVQAEAHYVLQKAGFTPKAETQTQLYQAIVKIIDDNRKTASLTQKGETKLYTGYDSQSEDLALTPKTAYQLKQLIDSNTRALGNVIPNSKKSSAVDSNSADTVATSAAVKTAYDKGVEAKNAADNAQRTANDGVSKANAAQHTANDGVSKANAAQHTANDGVSKANAANNNANGRVSKSGDSLTGILHTVGIASTHFGQGAYSSQYSSSAPFLVESTGSKDKDTYHPFVKGLVRSKGHYGAGFSFGYTTKLGAGDGFGRGIIQLIEDNGTNKLWGFEHNGDFNSAGDVRSSGGKSLNKSVSIDDFSQNLSNNGWCKLPNGLILQWGGSTNANILFPIAFPSVCLAVSHSKTGTGRDTRIESVSRTGFKSVATGSIGTTYYIAVGK